MADDLGTRHPCLAPRHDLQRLEQLRVVRGSGAIGVLRRVWTRFTRSRS